MLVIAIYRTHACNIQNNYSTYLAIKFNIYLYLCYTNTKLFTQVFKKKEKEYLIHTKTISSMNFSTTYLLPLKQCLNTFFFNCSMNKPFNFLKGTGITV